MEVVSGKKMPMTQTRRKREATCMRVVRNEARTIPAARPVLAQRPYCSHGGTEKGTAMRGTFPPGAEAGWRASLRQWDTALCPVTRPKENAHVVTHRVPMSEPPQAPLSASILRSSRWTSIGPTCRIAERLRAPGRTLRATKSPTRSCTLGGTL